MNKKIFVFGDSIAWGAWDLKGGWVSRLKGDIDKKNIDTDFDYYVAVCNMGISGDTTREVLQRFNREISSRIEEDDEEVIILFAIGINDSQIHQKNNIHEVEPSVFQENLHKLFVETKNYTKHVVFIGLTPVNEELTNPIPWKRDTVYLNEEVEKYDQAIKSFCQEANIPFIDIVSEFQKEDYKELLIDGLHPNTKGHERMYEVIKTFLINSKLV